MSEKLTRRDFLKLTGAVAGAALATQLIGWDKTFAAVPGSTAAADSINSDGIIFPWRAHAQSASEGYGILNVQTLFGAKGDGVTDDTAAIIAAYDRCIGMYRLLGPYSREVNFVIYFPQGTYLVSDTLKYSFPAEVFDGGKGSEVFARVRFQGQSRNGVIIKLKDNAPGFGTSKSKPVISFSNVDGNVVNALAASNYVLNLTIDTGKGNPGATGVRFCGANNSAIRDVTIRSGDGTGYAGIDYSVDRTQGLYENILIQGFNYAVSCQATPRAFSTTFENITVSNQKMAGFLVGREVFTIRKLTSTNTVPALRMNHRDGLVVLLDSTLAGGSADRPAIDLQSGHLTVRSLNVQGYNSIIDKAGKSVRMGNELDYYVSDELNSPFFGSLEQALQLPAEEDLRPGWPTNPESWANVQDYGAVGDGTTDDSAAIQRAMNSNVSTVYFQPGKAYRVANTISIPATVDRIIFMYCNVFADPALAESNSSVFEVSGAATDRPLMMERLMGWHPSFGAKRPPVYFVEHASTRTLIMQDMHHQHQAMYRNSVRGAKVYMYEVSCRTDPQDTIGVSGVPGFVFTGQTVWMRGCNSEYGDPCIVNDASTLWSLGGKTEGAWTWVKTQNGGKSELLGNMYNVNMPPPVVTPPNWPIISNNDNSRTTGMFATWGGNFYFSVVATESKGPNATKSLRYTEVPVRLDATAKQIVVPNYCPALDLL